MNCKFKYGDRVWAGNHAGKIISIRKYNSNYICKVKFENRFLIPQEMEYKESELELIKKSKTETSNNKPKCTCGIEKTYGKIPIENHKYYCDLVNPEKEDKKEDEELLERFQSAIEGYYDDDDDDDGSFGFFD